MCPKHEDHSIHWNKDVDDYLWTYVPVSALYDSTAAMKFWTNGYLSNETTLEYKWMSSELVWEWWNEYTLSRDLTKNRIWLTSPYHRLNIQSVTEWSLARPLCEIGQFSFKGKYNFNWSFNIMNWNNQSVSCSKMQCEFAGHDASESYYSVMHC